MSLPQTVRVVGPNRENIGLVSYEDAKQLALDNKLDMRFDRSTDPPTVTLVPPKRRTL